MTELKTPSWGKGVGISMIVLGSLGILFSFYRFAFLKIVAFQQEMLNEFDKISADDGPSSPFGNSLFKKAFHVSEFHENFIHVFTTIGFIICILYIIAGAKLLKAKPQNYNFARIILILSVALAIIQYFMMLGVGGYSMLILGLLVYNMFGTACDIALMLILLLSNKAQYGIGVDTSLEGYTKSIDDDII
ncbi:MAG: hypothetical protein MI810_22125 [Flavobacteriales bacterium]|jgi:hypothetical protein|nr:hypothetical protein [Flavobacteriales bacterium]